MIILGVIVGFLIYFSKHNPKSAKGAPRDHEEKDVEEYSKLWSDALSHIVDSEMEKLNPSQREEAEKFGKIFSDALKKMDKSEQEKIWNAFAENYNKQKRKEAHKKDEELIRAIEEGLEKGKVKS